MQKDKKQEVEEGVILIKKKSSNLNLSSGMTMNFERERDWEREVGESKKKGSITAEWTRKVD